MKATVEWLRIYKIPDGKPENQFAFNGEFKDRNFALKIIDEMHKHWEGLVSQNVESRNISWYTKTFYILSAFSYMLHHSQLVLSSLEFFISVQTPLYLKIRMLLVELKQKVL